MYRILLFFSFCVWSNTSLFGQATYKEIDSLLSEIETNFHSIYNCDTLASIGYDSLLVLSREPVDVYVPDQFLLRSDTMWNRPFEYDIIQDVFILNGKCAEWNYSIGNLLYEKNILHFRERLIDIIMRYKLDCFEILNFNRDFRLRHTPENWLFRLQNQLKDLLHSSDYIALNEVQIFEKLVLQGWAYNRTRYGFTNSRFEEKLLYSIIKEIPDTLILEIICSSSRLDKQLYFDAYSFRKTSLERAVFMRKLRERGIKFYMRTEIYNGVEKGENHILDRS